MANYQFLDKDGIEVAARYLKVTDDKVESVSLNTLKLIFNTAYIGGTWSVVGGDESHSGTVEDDEIELALLKHETTYNITVSCDGEEYENSVTTGRYWDHYTVSVGESAPLNPVDLENTDWSTISQISKRGEASAYWGIGDTKGVELDTYIKWDYPIQGTYYVYIIGFDHNSDLEGNNTIHFQFAKTETGTDICFMGAPMNSSVTNTGGWEECVMRNTTCQEFLEALPSDLQSVIKWSLKYTDNVGGSVVSASNVYASWEKLFLLSEYETFGHIYYANEYEEYYQEWYEYYEAGNSTNKYDHAGQTFSSWWLRSVSCQDMTRFVAASDIVLTTYASNDYGFAPAFVV